MFKIETIEKLRAKAIELIDLSKITLRNNEELQEAAAAAALSLPPLISDLSNPEIKLDSNKKAIAIIDANDESPVFAAHPKKSMINRNDFKKINTSEKFMGASFSPFKDDLIAFHCNDNFVKVLSINFPPKIELKYQSPFKV